MIKRAKIKLSGAVQGVGFRPFVYNLAYRYNLKGYIINDTEGVLIEVEGEENNIKDFIISLNKEKPKLSHIFSQNIEFFDDIKFYEIFEIKESKSGDKKDVFILPDISTCDECLKELFDKSNRRFLYPFINCTNCGPRFSIIKSIPYDRTNTTMSKFLMCEKCILEYENPLDRRFHAQPNACHKCGPDVFLYKNDKTLIDKSINAIYKTVELLNKGEILALKGIGGFHLVCDATNKESVVKLREKKKRFEKPFAVMFKDLQTLESFANLTDFEKVLVLSPERPIVLVEKKEDSKLAESVAPYIKKLGVFLPYSPLHYILLNVVDKPLVMTSANLSDEPIVKDNEEAFEKLSNFCDYIFLHNRDIENRVDDSVVFSIKNRMIFVRRSRGYAPLPIKLPYKLDKNVLAVGGHQKVVFAIAFDNKVFLSQHIGDLETISSQENFTDAVEKFLKLYDFKPDVVISDLHPKYFTTQWAENFSVEKNIKHLKVQHHYAHALSLMVDNYVDKEKEILAVCWDGTGFGIDGNIWGGEFLISSFKDFKRIFHLDYYKLIGGERAVKEPRRVALSLLFHIFGEDALNLNLSTLNHFQKNESETLFKMWKNDLHSPKTSSIGRLFDGVASLLDICHTISYEGQSGMILEKYYNKLEKGFYSFSIDKDTIDFKPLVLDIINDKSNLDIKVSRFINTLAKIIIEIGQSVNLPIGLTGGVFQNKALLEKVLELSEKEKVKILLHKNVPPNDGGLALGQVAYSLFN